MISFSSLDYAEWSDNTARLRREYLDGKHTAEEFLRLIDTAHALDSYEVDQPEWKTGERVWQRRVRGNLDFDPVTHYTGMMFLDLGADDLRWEFRTAKDQIREDQEGHQSLREKYRTK